MKKLSALFKNSLQDWIEVDLSRWGNKERDNEKFELIKEAVIQTRCIKITYAGSYYEPTEKEKYSR